MIKMHGGYNVKVSIGCLLGVWSVVKVKFALEQALKALRGSIGIALLFL
jgi:hypothetical protein